MGLSSHSGRRRYSLSRSDLLCPPSPSPMKIQHLITIVLTVVVCATTRTSFASPATDLDWDRIINALHQIETSGRLGPIVGDGGAALGPLQIHRGYHADSRVKGPYSNCSSLAYSRTVVRAYMDRYATKRRLGHAPTPVDIARIHNGGPNGYKKKATLGYARKFMELYNK